LKVRLLRPLPSPTGAEPPILLDLQTIDADEDHVVALFKERNLWGAISKTNNPVLRWRDPVYTSVRELAMSYFNEYFLPSNGEKSLKAYSRPFDLSKYRPEKWVTARIVSIGLRRSLMTRRTTLRCLWRASRWLKHATPFERKVTCYRGVEEKEN
jgi:hypothetical protein